MKYSTREFGIFPVGNSHEIWRISCQLVTCWSLGTWQGAQIASLLGSIFKSSHWLLHGAFASVIPHAIISCLLESTTKAKMGDWNTQRHTQSRKKPKGIQGRILQDAFCQSKTKRERCRSTRILCKMESNENLVQDSVNHSRPRFHPWSDHPATIQCYQKTERRLGPDFDPSCVHLSL